MRRIAISPSLRLCTALLVCVGVLVYGAVASSQFGIVERPEMLGGPAQVAKVEGDANIINIPPGHKVVMVAPEDSVVHFMGPPEMPEGQWGVNVWVEATFVQMDRRITRDFERGIGFKLSPPDGKAILTPEEKERILAAIEKTESARIIASLVVLTIPGQQAQSEHVEELTYATEYVLDEENIIPGNWEQRDIGAIFNVTPVVQEDGQIVLVMMPEVTLFCGWNKIDGSEVTQPAFKTWNFTTSVIIPDGSAFVLKESPPTPPFSSQAIDPNVANDPENQVTLLTIISAKLVEVPGEVAGEE